MMDGKGVKVIFVRLLVLVTVCLRTLAAGIPKKLPQSDFEEEPPRLERGCLGCYPSHRSNCTKEQFSRCCEQEIRCHQHACRQRAQGRLRKGDKVRTRIEFESDDEEKATLAKGMNGKVLRVDEDDDALIKFFPVDFDDEEHITHWVYSTDYSSKLELVGNSERLRVLKVVACLDNCTWASGCRQPPEMSKKRMGKYLKCIKSCNMDECKDDAECKWPLDSYATCKQSTSDSKACSPLPDERNEL
jgi:hypothetical protein